jgi:hypothetical protein
VRDVAQKVPAIGGYGAREPHFAVTHVLRQAGAAKRKTRAQIGTRDVELGVQAERRMTLPLCLHDMDSPCSYGIGCARSKTVVRSITEQGESR